MYKIRWNRWDLDRNDFCRNYWQVPKYSSIARQIKEETCTSMFAYQKMPCSRWYPPRRGEGSFFSEYQHRLHANHFHWVVIRERELWMSKTGEIQSHPFPFSGNLPMYRIANSSLCIQCTPNSAVLCIVVSLSEIPGSIVRKGRHWE